MFVYVWCDTYNKCLSGAIDDTDYLKSILGWFAGMQMLADVWSSGFNFAPQCEVKQAVVRWMETICVEWKGIVKASDPAICFWLTNGLWSYMFSFDPVSTT